MGTMIFIAIIAVIVYSVCSKTETEKELQTKKIEEILGHDDITPEQRQRKLEHWYNGGKI
jgi:uncharacterized membrane protein YvbJ